jgi:site-specific DNA-cytosine methylase
MENVSNVVRHQVFNDFIKTLERIGYYVSSELVDCADYGLPQSRRRTVLTASLLGRIELPASKLRKRRTVRSAIGDLPHLEAGGRDPRDPLHTSSGLSPLNLERISKPIRPDLRPESPNLLRLRSIEAFVDNSVADRDAEPAGCPRIELEHRANPFARRNGIPR